ncbi:phage tail protein [Lysobacter sp. K5869]|uniref:phage tail protein n=1 Tax=Lysobacter sp. K5869 TaxID=2820808 RepID=UPI001C06173C|nr:tail fiber protein [Lysobacter sp. K5869]QWP75685.1 phage tail protein [Lysobacter sp. K5869]
MTEVFLGQIMPVAFNYPPRGFAFCNGQLMAIAQNQALFSLLGTTYGGNGTTNFALPDLRSRTPVGFGNGTSGYTLGEQGGVENVTLLTTQLPNHTHAVSGTTAAATTRAQRDGLYAKDTTAIYANTGGPQVTMGPSTVTPSGGTQPHTNIQPYLTINFCIALSGIYPSRN